MAKEEKKGTEPKLKNNPRMKESIRKVKGGRIKEEIRRKVSKEPSGDPKKPVQVGVVFENGHTEYFSNFATVVSQEIKPATKFSKGELKMIFHYHFSANAKETIEMGLGLITEGQNIITRLVGLERIK